MTVGSDPDRVAEILREVAAAEILPRFRHPLGLDIHEKAPGQVVTAADIAAECHLTRRLTDLLPAAVVGEEGVATDPDRLSALARPGPVWVIDPVDGTANFARGHPRFAMILALVVDGVTRQGWIYDPVGERMVIAGQGEGAWGPEGRLMVTAAGPLESLRGSARRSVTALSRRVARVMRKGSAAHDYLDLVGGRLDFAHFQRLMPWDHAAGVLIHAEAGGYGRLCGGARYRPDRVEEGALLLAPDEATWRRLEAVLAG